MDIELYEILSFINMTLNKNIFKKTFLIMIFFSFFGCKSSKKTPDVQPSFPIYGNYCGPLYPPKGSTPIPIDAVDNACKNHDMCYDYYGYFDKDCDNAIINELNYIKPQSNKEELARKLLITYFIKAQKI